MLLEYGSRGLLQMPRENGATIMSQDFDPARVPVEIVVSCEQSASGNVTVTSLCRLERLQEYRRGGSDGRIQFQPDHPGDNQSQAEDAYGIGWFAV